MQSSKRKLSKAQEDALVKGRGSGAGGRPSKGHVKKQYSLHPDVIARIAAHAAKKGIDESAALTELVERE